MEALRWHDRGVHDPTPERDRLLSLVADHVLAHGTGDLSLSALARAVGSNNRMLLYYFGRKEDLLDEAGQVAVRRFPHVAGLMDQLRTPGPLDERLDRAWAALAHPDNTPFLQLFFERYGAALRSPEGNAAYLERMGLAGWPAELGEVLRAEGMTRPAARRCALEVVAMWRGLQLGLLSGVPREQLAAVHSAFARRLVAGEVPTRGGRNRAAATL